MKTGIKEIVKSIQVFLSFELPSLGSCFETKENERKGAQRAISREAWLL